MQKINHLARIIILTALLLVLAGHLDVALAQDVSKSPALIFYEIRGNRQEEGTLPKDIDSIKNSDQPVTFLWTYTKLFDESAISLVRGLNTYQGGVLLEVDDSLRKDAGVKKDTLWPASIRDVERTTILGYSQSDRRKLADTFIQKYIRVFGQAPQVVSSRIIDTPTANYLKDTYGIRFQIIDEEYKDKDHSMLDGGPSLVPYPASANWLLVPDHSNPNPVWVIRKPPQDLDYSLLGGDRITRIYIYSNIPFAKNVAATTEAGSPPYDLSPILQSHQSLDLSFIPELHSNDISFTSYGSIDVKLYEVTTPIYRMRVLRNKSDMWITDIRLYNKNLIDPYTSRIAHYGYYMVVPYLLNETGWKDGKITYLADTKSLSHLSLPNIDNSNVYEADVGTVGDHLAYIMQYSSNSVDGKKIIILFNKDTIQVAGYFKSTQKLPYTVFLHPLNPIAESRDSLSWTTEGKKLFGANLDCRQDSCLITFNTRDIALYNNAINKQPLFTFPEPELLNSKSKANLVTSRRVAVVGKKVSISLINQSLSGLTVVSSTKARTSTDQPISPSSWQKDSIYQAPHISLSAKDPADVNTSLTQDGQVLTSSIIIVPNCAQDWLVCIKSPKSLFNYLFR